jgi:hypothetical protein
MEVIGVGFQAVVIPGCAGARARAPDGHVMCEAAGG